MITIGHRISNGAPEGIEPADLLRHMYVLGKTGSGKSTALLRLLSAWLETGNGAALVDPHGDLAGELLRAVPRGRASDVVVIDPADRERPVAWNPLYRVDASRRPVVAQGLVAAFRGVWGDSWGPRLEYILLSGLRLLLDAETESLLGLQRLLVDDAYRAHLVGHCGDPIVRRFWELEFGSWDARFRREAVAPLQNKVGQFLSDPLMRSILGQRRSRLDLRLSMDRGRIIVASLSKGLVGEGTANLFGSLLVSSLHEAALSRADLPERERRPFLLAVDEFHNVGTDAFTSALSEARKYGLGLVLSHQYLDQLRPDIRSAVIGNAGSMLLFRMGGEDGSYLGDELGKEWPASRLAELAPFEAVLYTSSGGGLSEARKIRTLDLEVQKSDEKQIASQMNRSRQRFGTDGLRVSRRIAAWLSRDF